MIRLPPEILLQIINKVSVAEIIRLLHLNRQYRETVIQAIQQSKVCNAASKQAVLSHLSWLKINLHDPILTNSYLLSSAEHLDRLEVLLETTESFSLSYQVPTSIESGQSLTSGQSHTVSGGSNPATGAPQSLLPYLIQSISKTHPFIKSLKIVVDEVNPKPLQSPSSNVTRVYQLFKYWNLTSLDLDLLEITYIAENDHDNSIRVMIIINLLAQINWEVCKVTVNLHLQNLQESDLTTVSLLQELPLTLNLEVESGSSSQKSSEADLHSIYSKHSYVCPY